MRFANWARRTLFSVAALLSGVLTDVLDAAALDECAQCAGKGVVECRLCASKPCASERGFLFCSFAADCGDCGGARTRECEACDAKPEVDPGARRAEIAAWREARKSVDQAIGRPVGHGESAHFVLVSDLKKAEGEHASSPHGAVHAYLDRLEALHAEFVAVLGCNEADFSSKTTVMIWSREADQRAASAKYTLQRSDDESKLMGAAPVVSLLYDYARFKGDRGLHQSVVHQTAHCLLSNVYKPLALGNAKQGWIDEGLAHYFEGKQFGDVRRACYLDPKRMDKMKPHQWLASVRAAVASGEAPSLT